MKMDFRRKPLAEAGEPTTLKFVPSCVVGGSRGTKNLKNRVLHTPLAEAGEPKTYNIVSFIRCWRKQGNQQPQKTCH